MPSVCPICKISASEIELAIPANNNHLLLKGCSTPVDNDFDWQMYLHRNESFKLALFKNPDRNRPILNMPGDTRKLHLAPSDKEGYYVCAKTCFGAKTCFAESFCDQLRWKKLTQDFGTKYVSLCDPPIYRYVSVIENEMVDANSEVNQLVGRCIFYVRYSHSNEYTPPGIDEILLNPLIALRHFSKFGFDKIQRQDVPELDIRSVLNVESEMSKIYRLHALPGSTYFVNKISFEQSFAPKWKFCKVNDDNRDDCGECFYGNFESRKSSTVDSLVGFILAPYCVVHAFLKSTNDFLGRKITKLACVTFAVTCIKCSKDFYNLERLLTHIQNCFSVNLNVEMYSKNCPK